MLPCHTTENRHWAAAPSYGVSGEDAPYSRPCLTTAIHFLFAATNSRAVSLLPVLPQLVIMRQEKGCVFDWGVG